MANKRKPFGRIRLVYRRSSPLIKCVVLLTIVICTVALLTLRASIQDAREQTEQLRLQAVALEEENRKLTQYIAEAGTVQSIRRIAIEELGLADPDSEFFYPVEGSNPE